MHSGMGAPLAPGPQWAPEAGVLSPIAGRPLRFSASACFPQHSQDTHPTRQCWADAQTQDPCVKTQVKEIMHTWGPTLPSSHQVVSDVAFPGECGPHLPTRSPRKGGCGRTLRPHKQGQALRRSSLELPTIRRQRIQPMALPNTHKRQRSSPTRPTSAAAPLKATALGNQNPNHGQIARRT